MSDMLWAAILGMLVVTYVVRASFIVFGQKLRFPPAVVQALSHVPVAGACTEFCVNGLLAGNCRIVWRHNEREETCSP